MKKQKLGVNKQKLLIICGPTATGKTDLAIKLAKKFNGEIVSADSRQVYKGMDIGTGKDLSVNSRFQVLQRSHLGKNQGATLTKKFQIGYYLVNDIPIWGLDIVNPDYQFNVGEYSKIAQKIIIDIWQREKLPIIVGGTGLYIKSLLEPMEYTVIPPNKKLRKILVHDDVTILRKKLEKLDKKRLEDMNNSDRNNPRRLIRAIEIAEYLKTHKNYHFNNIYHCSGNKNSLLLVGLTAGKKILFKRIEQRIKKRLKQGIIREIKKLVKMGYGWNLPAMSGLGYKEFKPYFEKKQKLAEVIKKWQTDEQNYAKKQLVWFLKMPAVWFDITVPDFYTVVEKRICNFLQKA
ncbi:MAG: tRNA (adenosine(37)-N6)-dimethylallyltransferase MiaA [Patescibacteria group bacterium]|nr:tRNA (adenosine(37)-N6)-dimethylallyltransferase MiaA [Patescibacteria group bacterium]